MKRWRSVVIGVVVSIASLALALQGNNPEEIVRVLSRGNYLYLIPGVLLAFLGQLPRALRWRSLLNDRLTAAHSFNVMNIGYLLNTILPFRLGEIARAFLTTRLQPPIPMFTSFSSVVVERLTDTLSVVVLILIAIAISPSVPAAIQRTAFSTGVLVIVGMIVIAFFAARRDLAHRLVDLALRLLPFLERLGVRQIADRVLDGIAPLGSVRGAASVLFWTAVSWGISVATAYVLLPVFFDEASWLAALLAISSAAVAVALPALPGNVGPYEAAVIVGLGAAGFAGEGQREEAFAFAVLVHILNVLLWVGCGWYGLIQEKISFRELVSMTRQVASRAQGAAAAPDEVAPQDKDSTTAAVHIKREG
jgi:hypothetical protein